jgi:hypothetical protein
MYNLFQIYIITWRYMYVVLLLQVGHQRFLPDPFDFISCYDAVLSLSTTVWRVNWIISRCMFRPFGLHHVKWNCPCNRPWKPSRFPHFLENRLTDGGEFVSLTSRPPFTSRKIPPIHFCQRLSRPQGHRVLEVLGQVMNFHWHHWE